MSSTWRATVSRRCEPRNALMVSELSARPYQKVLFLSRRSYKAWIRTGNGSGVWSGFESSINENRVINPIALVALEYAQERRRDQLDARIPTGF